MAAQAHTVKALYGAGLFQAAKQHKHDPGGNEGHLSALTVLPKFSLAFLLSRFSRSPSPSGFIPRPLSILNYSHMCPSLAPLSAEITCLAPLPCSQAAKLKCKRHSMSRSHQSSLLPQASRHGTGRLAATEATVPESRKTGSVRPSHPWWLARLLSREAGSPQLPAPGLQARQAQRPRSHPGFTISWEN